MANTSICMKSIEAILGAAVMGLMPATIADAANPEAVTVDMTFMDPITITENNPLEFGLLDVNIANLEVVRVRPSGSVVDNDNNILGGTQAAANLTVTAQVGSTINIDAGNAGEDRMKSNTYVHIYDPANNWLQTVRFHTSCSQPLFPGDQFGSLILQDLTLH